jgi:hypothetical protein
LDAIARIEDAAKQLIDPNGALQANITVQPHRTMQVMPQIGQYNLTVDVDGSDGTPVDPGAVNELCQKGNMSGETEEHQGGSIYLDIQSEGSWTIQAQQ